MPLMNVTVLLTFFVPDSLHGAWLRLLHPDALYYLASLLQAAARDADIYAVRPCGIT